MTPVSLPLLLGPHMFLSQGILVMHDGLDPHELCIPRFELLFSSLEVAELQAYVQSSILNF